MTGSDSGYQEVWRSRVLLRDKLVGHLVYEFPGLEATWEILGRVDLLQSCGCIRASLPAHLVSQNTWNGLFLSLGVPEWRALSESGLSSAATAGGAGTDSRVGKAQPLILLLSASAP